MAFLDRFRKNTENYYGGQIEKFGVVVVNDEKLFNRIGVFDEMHQHIMESAEVSARKGLEAIEEQVHLINTMLHRAAIPFGRAGSEKWYAEAMSGWSTLHTKMLDIIHSARALLERSSTRFTSESEKRELVGKIWNFFENVYLKYALLISEISWMREDVSPSWLGVIQPQFQPQAPFVPIRTLDTGSVQNEVGEKKKVRRKLTKEGGE